jgi:hypothetical protein
MASGEDILRLAEGVQRSMITTRTGAAKGSLTSLPPDAGVFDKVILSKVKPTVGFSSGDPCTQ